MTVIFAWLRLELRRRWRALLLLVVLIAIAAGTVLTAVAGARRGASSVDRLLAETLPAHAVVAPSQFGFDWAAVRALPQVEALSRIACCTYTVDGISSALAAGDASEFAHVIATDPDLTTTVEHPVVLAGRLTDPTRADEVVVTARYAELHGLDVGDVLQLGLYRPESVDPLGNVPLPVVADGPVVPVRVVGVIRWFFLGDEVGSSGQIVPSAALFDRYRPNLNLLGVGQVDGGLGLVRLRGGDAALPEFRAALARVTGREDISVTGAEKKRRAGEVVRFEAAALLAFGLAALAAAMALVGQAVVRYAAGSVPELRLLRGVGMTPRQSIAMAAVAPVVAALVGATLGVAAAVLASGWMPFGAAAAYEPRPGLDFDWLVLVPGWLLVPVLVGGVAAMAAAAALAKPAREAAGRSSTVARVAASARLPVPMVVGTRFALEPGSGRSAVPVRPALIGAVTGVVGVVAAFTVAAGVTDAVENPERFGQIDDGVIYLGTYGLDSAPAAPILAMLDAHPDIAAIRDIRYDVGVAGAATLKIHSGAAVGTTELIPIALLDGAAPQSDGQMVLAPASARQLDARIGSTVTLSGDAGRRELRVVGIGLTVETENGDYSEGAWVTPGTFGALFSGFDGHGPGYAFHDRIDPAAATERVSQAMAAIPGAEGAGVYLVPPPQRVGEIRDVQALPVLLGVFLALLAVGAVGHTLATAVRRRRHDLAVLRALGMTRRQCRGIVFTQATLLAAVGLAFGVPLGIALGRTVWRLVAESTPLVYQPPAVALTLLLVVLATFVLANLLAVLPSRRAVRLAVNQVLRAE